MPVELEWDLYAVGKSLLEQWPAANIVIVSRRREVEDAMRAARSRHPFLTEFRPHYTPRRQGSMNTIPDGGEPFCACCVPAEAPEFRVDLISSGQVFVPRVVWNTMRKGKRTLQLATGDMSSSVEICRHLHDHVLASLSSAGR